MRKKATESMVILLDYRHRESGSGDFDGKHLEWEEAQQIVGIPLESSTGRVRKYTVMPECVPHISAKLEDTCWGALVELDFQGKLVSEVTVMSDWLADFYDHEN